MKKKQIEKIPYITIAKPIRKRGVKYIAVTAWKNISHERHIILEVYRNKKGNLQIPVVRYAATGRDWGVFFPETGEWSRQKIVGQNAYGRCCWQQPGEERQEQGSVLQTPEDLDRISNFFKEIKVWDKQQWWDYFSKNETRIRNSEVERKNKRRRDQLQERIKDTPQLKEQELLEWASKKLIMTGHYLYYKKRGRRADICCSACGSVTSTAWKPGESYESQAEKMVIEPRDGRIGYCPSCGIPGTYKPQGKAKTKYEIKTRAFTADRYHGNGVVLRYVELYKTYALETLPDEKGQQKMLTAYEEMEGIEIARTYYVPGRKVQTDFNKHNPYTGGDYWDDCNLYGLNNITIGKAMIHPDTWEALKGTFLQYSAMEEYAEETGLINARDYLSRYVEWPQIEMLVKMKLFGIVDSMVKGLCGIIAGEYSKRPEDFLGIRKDRMKLLVETRGNLEILNVLQAERRMGGCWTCEQVRELAEIRASCGQISRALEMMTVQKLLNNISGYAGCEYGTECSNATARLRHTATTYFDYLDMRVTLGYDMTNTVYQKPRNLSVAHQRMVMEINKKEQENRLKDTEQRYPDIRKQYRKLRNRYYYADDNYLIRPARSAAEIVMEGRMLHHCVGGDNYLSSHNNGTSIILMLRHRSETETPYITVEIKDEQIIQWYGAHDKKPDKENMQKWLDRYTAMLECRRMGTTPPAEQETAPLLAYA